MFLAREKIKGLAGEGRLIEDNYDSKYVRQCSYDLRLGSDFYVGGKSAPEKLTEELPYLTLAPGQFAILTCYESINLQDTGKHNYMAFIALRSTFKMQGLVNISGFHVDPTHRGTLLFAVQNVGPSDILLKYREPTFTIFFALVTGDIGSPRKDEQGIHFKPKLEGIPLQNAQNLGGRGVTISELRKEIVELRRIVLVYGPIVVAALIALFANLVRNLGGAPTLPPPVR